MTTRLAASVCGYLILTGLMLVVLAVGSFA